MVKGRRRAMRMGFKAAIWTREGWMFTETVQDAEEFAEHNYIERPKVIDLKSGKRVLV